MKDSQNPGQSALYALIGNLRDGQYVIPDFQREFEWKPWDIRELLRSIMLDYYIGSLLLWKGKESNFDALSCEPLYGFNGRDQRRWIVLDGQQRLTALHYVFLSPDMNLPNRANRAIYYMNIEKFMAEEYDDAFEYWFASSDSIGKWLADLEEQYTEHELPMPVIGSKDTFVLSDWLQGYERHWREKAEQAQSAGDEEGSEQARRHVEHAQGFKRHIQDLLHRYQISYIELDQDLELGKVCDIFSQINSRGVRLDVFDLMNALLKPKGVQLKQMWREARERLEYVSPDKMKKMQGYILQTMSILCQSYCSPKYLYFLVPGSERPVRNPDGSLRKEVLIADKEDFEERWGQAVAALEGAIRMLRHPQEYGAISSRYLPYISMLPIFAALQAWLGTLEPAVQPEFQQKIQRWYWASVFSERYSSGVESKSAKDFQDFKACLEQGRDLELFKNLQIRRLHEMDLLRTKPGAAVHSGLFNLLILEGARDWISGKIPPPSELDDHHIVPASCQIRDLERNMLNTVLNRTPLTAETNRKIIRDRFPNQYLPEIIEQSGEKTVLDIMRSHFISEQALSILLRDPFTADDFNDFIKERQTALQAALDVRLGLAASSPTGGIAYV